MIEDITLIHPSGGANAKYHEAIAFNYGTGVVSVVSGGKFSYSGTAYLQNGGRAGGPGSKQVTISISGKFTSSQRGSGTYTVHAAGCSKHSFVTVWYD